MLATESNLTTIGRLRVKSNTRDPRAEQHRLRQLLRTCTLSPEDLSPSATLVVLRLTDPLPTRLRTSPFVSEPDPAWQRAVNRELDRILAGASRPVIGSVPAAAAAVVFLDRAEVLASLAVDWMQGALATNWWWRWLFPPQAQTPSSLFAEWIRSPEFVPAAMEMLSRRLLAVRFVQAIPSDVVGQLRTNVCCAHGLRNLGTISSMPSAASDGQCFAFRDSKGSIEDTDELDSVGSRDLSTSRPSKEAVHDFDEPWLPWIPEASAAGLAPEARLLLAQCLLLTRAPIEARSQHLQMRLASWLTQSGKSENRAQISARGNLGQPRLSDTAPADSTVLQTTRSDLQDTTYDQGSSSNSPSQAVKQPPPIRSDSGDETSPANEAPVHNQFDDQESARGNSSSEMDQAGHVPTASTMHDVASTGEAESWSATIHTAFGGLFFLLNVALHLGLYSDFTAPLGPNLDLNFWDFLALIGAAFTQDQIKNDPLWNCLADLAGRPRESQPGAEFKAPDEWRVPEDWLASFAPAPNLDPVQRDGRLITMHPAGFVIADIPVSYSAEQRAANPTKRWITWLAGFIGARLTRACERQDAVEVVCHCPARVSFTLTHVDVTFSLQSHPFEIRISGLDRDPGWIPAASRDVRFHFD